MLVFFSLSSCNNIIIFYMNTSDQYYIEIIYTVHCWHRSQEVPHASSDGVNNITDTISKLDIDGNVDSKTLPSADNNPVSGIKECKCGMPLCICEAPAPSSDALPQQVIIWFFFSGTFFGATCKLMTFVFLILHDRRKSLQPWQLHQILNLGRQILFQKIEAPAPLTSSGWDWLTNIYLGVNMFVCLEPVLVHSFSV